MNPAEQWWTLQRKSVHKMQLVKSNVIGFNIFPIKLRGDNLQANALVDMIYKVAPDRFALLVPNLRSFISWPIITDAYFREKVQKFNGLVEITDPALELYILKVTKEPNENIVTCQFGYVPGGLELVRDITGTVPYTVVNHKNITNKQIVEWSLDAITKLTNDVRYRLQFS